MKLKIGDEVFTLDGGIRVREMCEAEKALGMSTDEGGFGAKVAVALFVIERRADPTKPAVLIADQVLDLDMGTIVEVEEENPPAEPVPVPEPPPAEPEAPEEDHENPPISGHRPLVNSASPSL